MSSGRTKLKSTRDGILDFPRVQCMRLLRITGTKKSGMRNMVTLVSASAMGSQDLKTAGKLIENAKPKPMGVLQPSSRRIVSYEQVVFPVCCMVVVRLWDS